MKKLLTRDSYLKEINNKYYSKFTGVPVNEVFANDIPWGDTHIGRMINSIARKAKIVFNKRRISGLINGLKSLFDEMLVVGKVDMTNIDEMFLKISIYLGLLEEQVKDENEEIDIIIGTTSDLIQFVTDYKFDEKEIMLKTLNDFLDFLKELKDGKVDNSAVVEEPSVDIYGSSLKLLQSVVQLHNLIISKQKTQTPVEKKPNKTNIQLGKEYLYGDKVVKVVDLEHPRKAGNDKKWLTGDDSRNKEEDIKPNVFVIWRDPQTKTYKPNAASQAVDPSKLKPISGDVNVSKKPVAVNASRQYDIIDTFINENIESDNIWNKIVKSYNTVGLSKMIPRIKELIEKSKDDNSNEKKYVSIIGKQVIMNKSTVGKEIPYDQLIKEEVDPIPTSYNDIPKAISLISRYILPVRDHKDILKDKVEEIKVISSFIDSFGELENLLKKSSTRPSEESKTESLVGYSKFLILLENSKYHSQILEKFNELFTDEIKKTFQISEEMRGKLENMKEYPEGQLVFTSSDPIIEIVRLFNRAWRIHTPGVIPSGRTGGRVSNSVFREYEDLGSGNGTPDSPGSGPYRNIELYDSWFESVQDILSDTKYRPIFSENAVFRFINEETGQEGDSIKKGGKILLKFINELLSDSKMYKSGAINKFIVEYFQLDPSKIEGVNTTYAGFENDSKNNNSTSSTIKTTEVEYRSMDRIKELNKYSDDLGKLFSDISNNGPYKNLAFRIEVDTKIYFCVYNSTENGYPIFTFSSGNYAYDLTKISGISKVSAPLNVYLASLEKNSSFKVGSTSKVKYVEISKNTVSDGDEITSDFKISKIEILCEKSSQDLYLELEKYLPNLKSNINRNLPKSKILLKK